MNNPAPEAASIPPACCMCHTTGPAVTVVGAIERASGPGWSVFACPNCASAVQQLLQVPSRPR
ncbi:hypothetical protein SAMN06272789_3316 [Streptomyces sp. 1331.2]|nr:hypothetical protein SAMN06272789_3316 [Streptomyces sp. 1331.2]